MKNEKNDDYNDITMSSNDDKKSTFLLSPSSLSSGEIVSPINDDNKMKLSPNNESCSSPLSLPSTSAMVLKTGQFSSTPTSSSVHRALEPVFGKAKKILKAIESQKRYMSQQINSVVDPTIVGKKKELQFDDKIKMMTQNESKKSKILLLPSSSKEQTISSLIGTSVLNDQQLTTKPIIVNPSKITPPEAIKAYDIADDDYDNEDDNELIKCLTPPSPHQNDIDEDDDDDNDDDQENNSKGVGNDYDKKLKKYISITPPPLEQHQFSKSTSRRSNSRSASKNINKRTKLKRRKKSKKQRKGTKKYHSSKSDKRKKDSKKKRSTGSIEITSTNDDRLRELIGKLMKNCHGDSSEVNMRYSCLFFL